MDKTTFRATYPGLFQEAFEAGADAERERASTIAQLAEAAGTSPRHAIETGLSPADAVKPFQSFAASSDARAAAFLKKVKQLGLDSSAQAGSGPTGGDDGFARTLAAIKGDCPLQAHAGGRSTARDMGDDIADAMFGKVEPK